MDARGVVAAHALGAAGVQMGTAFLLCDESGAAEAYKAALLAARDDRTTLTRVFSGRPARGLVNRFIADVEAAGVDALPFPLQNALTRPMRTAAAARGDAGAMSLWAGQAAALGRRRPAADLVGELVRECARLVRDLAAPDSETAEGAR
jgi:nitronate monooxygenase